MTMVRTAAHNYFGILNFDEAKKLFLDNPSTPPAFEYPEVEVEGLRKHMLSLPLDSSAYKNIEIVVASLRLREQKDQKSVKLFRRLNLDQYGPLQRDLAASILARAQRKATDKASEHVSFIQEQVPGVTQEDFESYYRPPEALFMQLRKYFTHYLGSDAIFYHLSVQDALNSALEISGLTSEGWRVKLSNTRQPLFTSHRDKVIVVGHNMQPRTTLGLSRMAIHEVYGHAKRGPQKNVFEAEGVATLLEQLINPSFRPVRTYRYLAAALGWGLLGEPMNFAGVHSVLWRVMVLGGLYDEQSAKSYAYDEAARVFRGGEPSLPGAVFLKDSVYYSANVSAWKSLEKQECSYDDFVAIIEGRKRVLE